MAEISFEVSHNFKVCPVEKHCPLSTSKCRSSTPVRFRLHLLMKFNCHYWTATLFCHMTWWLKAYHSASILLLSRFALTISTLAPSVWPPRFFGCLLYWSPLFFSADRSSSWQPRVHMRAFAVRHDALSNPPPTGPVWLSGVTQCQLLQQFRYIGSRWELRQTTIHL